jgi:hypothetical protein
MLPIVVQGCQLPQPFHGDPADQILVVTAAWGRAGDEGSGVSGDTRM